MQNTILYTAFLILSISLTACAQYSDEEMKKSFMDECNSTGEFEEYCECVFQKIYDL